MAQYRRKPGKIIEARQWTLIDGNMFSAEDWPMVKFDHSTGRCYIETMHAGQRVNLETGDWILPEPDGEHFYPCKPDIFAESYEAVDTPEFIVGALTDAMLHGKGVIQTRIELEEVYTTDRLDPTNHPD